jgi:hypothetical protein
MRPMYLQIAQLCIKAGADTSLNRAGSSRDGGARPP